MYILGISCFYHDSAACLVRDGDIVAAAQEERFSRKKHDSNFPVHAISFCLKEANIEGEDLDFVVFYEKPRLKFERILETHLSYAPFGITQFIQDMSLSLRQGFWIPQLIRKELGYQGKVLFTGHHESHAASAFYPSPFQDAAFLTMDGVGEWETASFGSGKDNALELKYYSKFPHSLGLLYSTFAYYAGFKFNSGEYKLMGLAPYGEPKYADLILKELLDLKDDGSFKLNMEYFGYCNSPKMTSSKFDRLFGGPARKAETKITQKDMDIASSIQKVTEEIMLKMARHVHNVTGQDNLCLAGGVALNCVGNSRILREGPFKDIWIQPASGDAGGALGAALLVWYKYLGNKRNVDNRNDKQKASLLGPSYSNNCIEKLLREENAHYRTLSDVDIPQIVADLIVQGKVIGWFQGRLEFGPRALGSRSIIADARNQELHSRINSKIKFRESFRPFAPTVLEDKVSEWFDLDKGNPYMLLVASARQDKRVKQQESNIELRGLDKLKAIRSQMPAVTHVDYSVRIQALKRVDQPLYYDMINAFYEKTDCPMVINTSFNVRGEPLVCTPEDALRCFMRTDMDYLIMGNFLLNKAEQRPLSQDRLWQEVFLQD